MSKGRKPAKPEVHRSVVIDLLKVALQIRGVSPGEQDVILKECRAVSADRKPSITRLRRALMSRPHLKQHEDAIISEAYIETSERLEKTTQSGLQEERRNWLRKLGKSPE